MTLVAHRLSFAPRQFARGRDYEATCASRALSPAIESAFTIVAERMLRAREAVDSAIFQYTGLGTEGAALLARCDFEEREGARAMVVWALMFPPEYVRSSGFVLGEYIDCITEAATRPDSAETVELQQRAPRLPAAGAAAVTLIGKYIESGAASFAETDADRALSLLCQAVEILPGGDRLALSFSTVKTGVCKLEVDAHAGPVGALEVSEEARVIAGLWAALKSGVAEEVVATLSLRHQSLDWLQGRLSGMEESRFASLAKVIESRLEAPLHRTAFMALRRALELCLSKLQPTAASEVLTRLHAKGYFGEKYSTPPIWLARLASKLNLYRPLSKQMWLRILQPASVPLLIEAQLSRPTAFFAWVGVTSRLQISEGERLGLIRACRNGWRDLLPTGPDDSNARTPIANDDTVIRTFALLLLYDACKRTSPLPKKRPSR